MDNDKQPLLENLDQSCEETPTDISELEDRSNMIRRVFRTVKRKNKEIKSITGYSSFKILSKTAKEDLNKYKINMPIVDREHKVDLKPEQMKLYAALIKIVCISFGFGISFLLDKNGMSMGSKRSMLKIAFYGRNLAKMMNKMPKEISYLNRTVMEKGYTEVRKKEIEEILEGYKSLKSKNMKNYSKAKELSDEEEKKMIVSFKKYLNLEYEDIGPLFIQHRYYEPTFTVTKHKEGTIGNENKLVVVSFRGTSSWSDVVIDFDFEPFDIEINKEKCQIHKGMLRCAMFAMKYLKPLFEQYDEEGYDIILTGHSLGAGVAAILTCLLKHDFPKIKGIVFGCPCCLSENLARSSSSNLVNYMFSTDMVSRLGVYQVIEAGLIYGQIKKGRKTIDFKGITKTLTDSGYHKTTLYVPEETYMFMLDDDGIYSFTDYYPEGKGQIVFYDHSRKYPVHLQKYSFDGYDMHMPFHSDRFTTHMYHQTLFCIYTLQSMSKQQEGNDK